MKKTNLLFENIIVSIYLISPFFFVAILPSSLSFIYQYFILITGFLFFLFFNRKLNFYKENTLAFIITCFFSIFAFLAFLNRGVFFPFKFIMPFYGLFAFLFLKHKNFRLNIKVFLFYYLIMYIIIYSVYLIYLPNLFLRDLSFNEDDLFFDNSSSNAIPISLNISLICFWILSRNRIHSIYFFLVSIINFVICLIQGSRLGVIMSLLLFLYFVILHFKSKYLRLAISFFFIFLLFIYLENIINIIEEWFILQGSLEFENISEDGRVSAQKDFLKFSSLTEFFLGHKRLEFNDFTLTYNVFFDIWNGYTFFGFLLFVFLFFFNFFHKINFLHFPLLLLCCSMFFESTSFPMYWDSIIIYGLYTKEQ